MNDRKPDIPTTPRELLSDDPTEASPEENPREGGSGLLRRLIWMTWSDRKRWLVIDAWIVLIAAYVALAAAYLFPQDLRNSNGWYAGAALGAFLVRTFRFHIGVALLIVTGGALALRRQRLALAAAPLLVFAFAPAIRAYLPKNPAPIAGESLTVISANLLAVNRDTGELVREIVAADADLLLLQEYAPHWFDALHPAITSKYPHREFVIRDDSFGIAIYSKRPFGGPVRTDLRVGTIGTPQMRAVIRLDGREVALYNLHLYPPKGARHTVEHRRGVADVLRLIGAEELPVILTGDFNFTEDSYMAARLRGLGLRDTHSLAGFGRAATWPNRGPLRFVPGVRIDHLYISRELTSRDSWRGGGHGSDHRPIGAAIGFAQRAPP